MSEYWRDFWDQHIARARSDDPMRQVLRQRNKEPLSDEAFIAMAARTAHLLELEPHHVVLDLCCGNGLLTARLAPHCCQIVGVDFCMGLVVGFRRRATRSSAAIAADASQVDFQQQSFHRVVLAAALQHFTQAQTIHLMKRVAAWLKPGGIFVVTDIPDSTRMWCFFDSRERESAYFENTMRETPIIGTWFDPRWLEKLGLHAGFQAARAVAQPSESWDSHYRFDLLCRK